MPGRYRWEFRLRPGERPEDFDHAKVLELIRPWLSGVDIDKLTFLRQATYTFRGVVADRWRNGRVFLLGDAAHLTPPFIGQGMCAGIRDAANLAWKLALVVQGDADDRLLDTYEAERRPYARRVVQLAIFIGWLMTGGTARTAAIRRAALRLATRIPGSANAHDAHHVARLPRGPTRAPPQAGSASSAACARSHGSAGRCSTTCSARASPSSTAARTGSPPTTRQTREFFDRLGTTVVRVDDLPDGGALARLLDNARADALLLRPDRIVAAAADTPDLRAWRRHLRAAGINPAESPQDVRHAR